MTKLKELKARFMEDPEFREEYARADEEYSLIEKALLSTRAAADLTQAELSRHPGTTRSVTARRGSPTRGGSHQIIPGSMNPTRRSKEEHMPKKDEIDKVWDKAKRVRGENPDVIRQDPYGNKIRKSSYGKDSEMGWEIDHIKPSARGGSDSLRNKQALKTSVNREKGDSLVKRSRHNQ